MRFLRSLLLSLLAVSGLQATEPARPNVIFILADDLGYGDLGCYGQTQIQTPHLDRFAKQGIRFTQAYAGSTVCAPSRCTLMLGQHTGHCRVRGNARVPLKPGDVTVAELFKQAGYTTGLIGKWGLGEPNSTGIPTRQGFDTFFGYLNQRHAHNYYPTYLWRDEQKVPLANVLEAENIAKKAVEYSQDRFAAEVENFLEKNKDQPFFLYYAMTLPHANNERGRAQGNGMEIPSDAPYSDRNWPQPQKNHAAMITRLDADVGKLMHQLQTLGLDEKTLVIFTSDNGPHREGGAKPEFFDSNGPLQGIKRNLTEGGIRVPALARWPGVIQPGDSHHVWAFWDFLPTVAELVKVEAPQGIDGISFLPTLTGREPQRTHATMYWEFHERGFHQAVRMGKWKGIRDNLGPVKLFDLSEDLSEQTNRAKEHPEVVERIAKAMDRARTESQDWPIRVRSKR